MCVFTCDTTWGRWTTGVYTRELFVCLKKHNNENLANGHAGMAVGGGFWWTPMGVPCVRRVEPDRPRLGSSRDSTDPFAVYRRFRCLAGRNMAPPDSKIVSSPNHQIFSTESDV